MSPQRNEGFLISPNCLRQQHNLDNTQLIINALLIQSQVTETAGGTHAHAHTHVRTHVQHIDEAAPCPGPKRVQWNTEYITSIHSSRTRQIKQEIQQPPNTPGQANAACSPALWAWHGPRRVADGAVVSEWKGTSWIDPPHPQTSGPSHPHQLYCHMGPSIHHTL